MNMTLGSLVVTCDIVLQGPVSVTEKTIFENLQVHLVSLHFAVNKIGCLIPKQYGLGHFGSGHGRESAKTSY